MKQCLLFLYPDRITCYSKGSAGYSIDQDWIISANQLPQSFSAYLSKNCHAEFTLLFDLPEEECHQQNLKRTGFRDRCHIVERLKRRQFESSLLSKATVSRLSQKLSLLLTGVDNNQLCENLIQTLDKFGVSFKAIHSATTLMPVLASQIAASKGAQLFIFPLRGCYRLVACMDSSVLFSRRVSLSCNADSTDHDPTLLHKSLEETLNYVQRLYEGWMPVVVLISSTKMVDQLRAIRISSLTSSEVKEIRSYLPEGVDSESACVEKLLISVASRSGSGYASKEHRRYYINRKVRNISAALALCGVSGVISSVAVADKINKSHDEVKESYLLSADSITRNIAHLESHYEQPVEAVRQALVTARLLELRTVQKPIDFLMDLAPSVQQSDVSITSVQWQTEEFINERLLGNQLIEAKSLETVPLEQIYKATVAGVVTGKPDVALDKFDSFVTVLREISSNPSVVVVETPFGLDDQNRTTNTDYTGVLGKFALEISNEKVEQ